MPQPRQRAALQLQSGYFVYFPPREVQAQAPLTRNRYGHQPQSPVHLRGGVAAQLRAHTLDGARVQQRGLAQEVEVQVKREVRRVNLGHVHARSRTNVVSVRLLHLAPIDVPQIPEFVACAVRRRLPAVAPHGANFSGTQGSRKTLSKLRDHPQHAVHSSLPHRRPKKWETPPGAQLLA